MECEPGGPDRIAIEAMLREVEALEVALGCAQAAIKLISGGILETQLDARIAAAVAQAARLHRDLRTSGAA